MVNDLPVLLWPSIMAQRLRPSNAAAMAGVTRSNRSSLEADASNR